MFLSTCRLLSLICVATSIVASARDAEPRPNVSRIALDDLQPELGCNGGASLHSPDSSGLMGYSIQTATHRLTQWAHREFGETHTTKLHDDTDSPVETEYIVSSSPDLAKDFSSRLASASGVRPVSSSDHAESREQQTTSGGNRFTSFEDVKAGRIDKFSTAIGTWTSGAGRAIIDDKHAKTGEHCLQLTGGEKTSVTLKVAEGVTTSGDLSFWTERWTKRSPFSFRIEKHTPEGWEEIFNGDKEVRVGRAFLSHVTVPLRDDDISQLRFTVSSPPNAGILIDDVRIARPQRQKIVGVEVVPVSLPALVGIDANPLLRLKIETIGGLDPISMTELQGTLEGTTDVSDISSLQLYQGGANGDLSTSQQVAHWDVKRSAPESFVLSCPKASCRLTEGTNDIWIAARLSRDVNIDHRIGVAGRTVTFSNGRTIKLSATPSSQRIGVALRNGGDDGVHTYRIPGLATTNRGTLIGVYDARQGSSRDLPGDIDVGMSRSTDGGKTWEPMKVIMDMGEDPQWKHDGIGDPAVLVDRTTGTIWVAATWSHGNRSWSGSGPGLKPEETGQLMLVRSDDDGVTWSEPINITRQMKRPEWCFLLQGPGKGITMRDGTIVFAAQYQDPPEQKRLPHSTIIYSKDHGETWQVGTGAFDDTTEAQVVESEPGVLMLNCRYNRKPVRVVMTTRDMGQTWQKHTTSERSLIEPGSCMASLIDVDQEVGQDAGSWMLFSNPDSTRGRRRITIKASPDRGLTWPKEHRRLLDEGNGRGYSCLSMIDERTVGILYEGSRADLTFQRIPLADLVSNQPQSAQAKPTPTKPTPTKQSLQLPRVFGDHMVLQADADIPVWGRAAIGKTVTLTFGDETTHTTANDTGEWQVRLQARSANAAPSTLVIESAGERIEFSDVLIGEVWVCAGQSNMQWPLSQSEHGPDELSAADHQNLRLLQLESGVLGNSGSYTPEGLARLTPASFCEGQWEVASAESANSFSAVGWYFGRFLEQELQVPVGLICPAVGGTPTESWIPRAALEADPDLRGLVAGNWLDNTRLGEFCRRRGEQNLLQAIQAGENIPRDDLGPNHSFKPGFMWAAGIEPLIPYAIRGAIWYQGESNAESQARVREHGRLFPLLVNEWRKKWAQGDFPFLYVQLPALNRPEWPWFRDGQRRTLKQLDNVGMAITIDTGHPSNVHPTLKQPVGKRLAKWALRTTYGLKSHAVFTGPLLKTAEYQSNSMVLSFEHVGRGLKSSDEKPLRYFEVCGKDGVFHPASAKIVGKNTVVVSNPQVDQPQHARYAWLPYPDPPVNLFNREGLPASPFSTETEETLFSQREAADRRDETEDTRPNILLIVGEDHGCELSCYGDPVIQTPNVDRLAAQGVLFENGYVAQSVCSPSRSTIFTGLYPHQNGQLGLATHKYGWFRKWPTTYSLLKKAGYRTGLIGKTHVIPAKAVEDFVDFRFQRSSNFSKKKVADYAVQAGEFFRSGEDPFFMTVNYPDSHWPLQGQVDGLPSVQVDPQSVQVMPYIGHETPRMREVVRNYYDCMLRLDACVGQLLKQLEDSGKADNTLVVFIADHGAQMARGKVTVYEGGVRVPYLVRWPGVTNPGQRSEALVSTIDLLPTFMDAAGVQSPKGLPGRSLRSIFSGDVRDDFREYLACERNCDAARNTFPQRTIRDAQYKLIHSPVRDREDPAARYYRIHGAANWSGCLTDEELAGASEQTRAGYDRWLHPPEVQLYDLKQDPHEWNDLSSNPDYASTKQQLLQALRQWQSDTHDPLTDPAKLKLLMEENAAVARSNRRSPEAGWQYLKYLAPDQP